MVVAAMRGNPIRKICVGKLGMVPEEIEEIMQKMPADFG